MAIEKGSILVGDKIYEATKVTCGEGGEVETETLTVTPTKSEQVLNPSVGKYIDEVIVNPIGPEYPDVSDTTASVGSVENGKVFYNSQGQREVGTAKLEKVGYDRPSWYPDVLGILESSQSVTIDGTTYSPYRAVLVNDYSDTITVYPASSSSSDFNNFYNGYYGDAYKFSDSDEIVLSADFLNRKVTHTWDKSKDFVNPSDNIERVRYIIIYNTSSNTYMENIFGANQDVIEAYFSNGWESSSNFSVGGYNTDGTPFVSSLKYLYFSPSTNMTTQTGYYTFMNLPNLVEIALLSTVGTALSYNSFDGNLKSLEKLTITNMTTSNVSLSKLPSLKEVKGFAYAGNSSSIYSYCPNLKVYDYSNAKSGGSSAFIELAGHIGINIDNIILPTQYVTSFGTNPTLSSIYKWNIKHIKIPSNIVSFTNHATTFLGYVNDVELYDGFDISGLKLYENTYPSCRRPISFLKKLAGWLKDKSSDEEAGTMNVGSQNILRLQNIYLTYNSNKNITAWVDAGTSGAISAFDFITQQKNWTLS